MGLPMAKNLAGAFSVKVYDPFESARKRAAESGLESDAPESFSPGDEWDAVFTMLPDARSVEALLLGDEGKKDGILRRAGGATLFADCSTTGAESARRIGEVAKARGVDFVDAPVSGGVAGAAAAKLSFLVGGETAALERVRPYLETMGAAVFHAGPAGAGQAAKMCNNMLLSVLMIGTCEALALGEANGLDAATLSEIMRKSSGGNWALEVYNPWPGVMPNSAASRDYEGGFLVDLMLKDSDLAMASARETATATPLGALANQIYRMHQRKGWGRRDFSSALEFIRDEGGKTGGKTGGTGGTGGSEK